MSPITSDTGTFFGIEEFILTSQNDVFTVSAGVNQTFSLDGGAGDDKLAGRNADDLVYGSTGDDTLTGLGGDDTLYGGQNADEVYGFDNADRLLGGDGSDTLYGGNGTDRVFGGAGDDRLIGGHGTDFLRGGEGADTFEFKRTSGNDVIGDFTAGEDILTLRSSLFGGADLETARETERFLLDGAENLEVSYQPEDGDEVETTG